MSREIKFRAWDKIKNKIYLIAGISFTNNDVWLRINDKQIMGANFSEIKLMQYTGLKDKNDKEIYEGDVIQFLWEEDSCWGKAGTYKGYIGFNQGAFEVIYISRDEITVFDDGSWHENSKSDDMQSFISWSEEIEVIGNIYENPELLKSEVEQ